jgi:hypothetical protein
LLLAAPVGDLGLLSGPRALGRILHSPCPSRNKQFPVLRTAKLGAWPWRNAVQRSALALRVAQARNRDMNARPLSIIVASGLLIATTTLGYAQSRTQENAPGQRMQDKGSVPGQSGASGYAPGQQMQEKASKSGQPGASGFAPGQQSPDTTGRGGGADKGSMGDRDPDRDRGDAR